MVESRYDFPTKPVADPKSIVSGPHYRFTVLTDGLIRYEWAPDGQFEDRASVFAINRALPVPSFRHTEEAGQLKIRTSRFHLIHDGDRFTPNSLMVRVLGGLTHHHSEWRYGLPAENLGGTARTLDDIDGKIELGPGVISRLGYAAIDDSTTMLFNQDGWIATRKEGEGRIDGYLFAYGHDYKAAVKALYALSGNQPLVPRWLLGNWWSRYHEYSADSYLALMDRFQAEGVPLSVAVIDMDWHRVNEEKVKASGKSGWTGYSWNRDLFPDARAFLKSLHYRGLKVTLNDHPADGVASYEDMYEDVAKAVGVDTSNKDPVDFDITNRKYCDAYFEIVQRGMQDTGMDFTWTDWQSGPYSRVPGLDPLWALNHYTFLDNKVKNPHEPVLFSRFAGPGSHRYPVGFSGDAAVSWASLRFQPEFTATASNIGYGWWSHDIGGHIGGAKDDELMARWAQSGVFSPLMRLHATNNRWMSKEPWLFGPECRAAMKDVMRFRHRLVPYLFAMSVRAAEQGEPLVQPIYWEWPKEGYAYEFKCSFFFGSELFVAPITEPRDPSTLMASVKAWLPPGRYVDIFTGVVYEGERVLTFHRKLDGIPVLAREGSIIPLDARDFKSHGVANPLDFEVLIVPGADCRFDIVERAGTEDVRMIIRLDHENGRLHISASPKAEPKERTWKLLFLACDMNITGINKRAIDAKIDKTPLGTSVSIGPVPVDKSIEVNLGKIPPLKTFDIEDRFEHLIHDVQIPFAQKDKIWQAVSGTAPVAMKASRVEAIELNDSMKGAVLEMLLADTANGA